MFEWLFKKKKYYADEWEVENVAPIVHSRFMQDEWHVVGHSITVLLRNKSSDKTVLIESSEGRWPMIQHELAQRGVNIVVQGETFQKVTLKGNDADHNDNLTLVE